MSELLGYCGLICNTCPIYLATKEIDKEEQNKMRAEIAKTFEKVYGIYFEASDIADCDGCRTLNGRLFSACNDCNIRQCANQKMIKNCAHCMEYACKELKTFFHKDASAKERLDKVRDQIFRGHRQKRDIKYR
jgi:predicted nuclease of restriction endonuclease-like RecB superfamily